jgi:hypothetical protein
MRKSSVSSSFKSSVVRSVQQPSLNASQARRNSGVMKPQVADSEIDEEGSVFSSRSKTQALHQSNAIQMSTVEAAYRLGIVKEKVRRALQAVVKMSAS